MKLIASAVAVILVAGLSYAETTDTSTTTAQNDKYNDSQLAPLVVYGPLVKKDNDLKFEILTAKEDGKDYKLLYTEFEYPEKMKTYSIDIYKSGDSAYQQIDNELGIMAPVYAYMSRSLEMLGINFSGNVAGYGDLTFSGVVARYFYCYKDESKCQVVFLPSQKTMQTISHIKSDHVTMKVAHSAILNLQYFDSYYFCAKNDVFQAVEKKLDLDGFFFPISEDKPSEGQCTPIPASKLDGFREVAKNYPGEVTLKRSYTKNYDRSFYLIVDPNMTIEKDGKKQPVRPGVAVMADNVTWQNS